ncbi:MAG: MFS transporter [Planctomycetota bacterium]
MDPLRRQYVLCFGVMGAVLSYLPQLLFERLGNNTEVGYIMATMGIAVITTPVIMTALADTHQESRSIIAALFAVSAGTCAWLAVSDTFLALLIAHTVFAFGFWPQAALQDGLVFARNRQRALSGQPEEPYHRIRVWGTVGFALPLLVIYVLLDRGMALSATMLLGAGICALGLLNALTLPHIELGQARRARYSQAPQASVASPAERFPTVAAARVLFRGPGLVFCIGMFIAHLPNAAFYTFYPVYLTDQIGFEDKWIGPIVMSGVMLELGVMVGVGAMTRKLGLKWLLVAGLCAMVLRFALMGLVPTPSVAVGTQLLHGITVIAMYVIPPIYLNTLAGDHFRSSIHGLYTMTVFGPARILGPVLAGWLGDVSLLTMFNTSAAVTLGAAVLIALLLRLTKEDPPNQPQQG